MLLTFPFALSRKPCLILRVKPWLKDLTPFKLYPTPNRGSGHLACPPHAGLGSRVLCAFTLIRVQPALVSQLKEQDACPCEFVTLLKQVTKNHEDPKLSFGGR